MRRLSGEALGLGLVLGCVGPAGAQDLCSRLSIPSQLGLACAPASNPAAVEVTPVGGTFALLSRLSVRLLDQAGTDAEAWSDPPGWLRAQMTPDTSKLSESLGGLVEDPDSPFTGDQASAALESLKRALAGVSALALGACDEPGPDGADRWQMRCNYAAEGLGLQVVLRLVAVGERRWAITMRAANEQRLRHFEAIANSFQPS